MVGKEGVKSGQNGLETAIDQTPPPQHPSSFCGFPPSKAAAAAAKLVMIEDPSKASDVLPLPLYITNGVFFTLFFSVVYYLLTRWREKIRNSTPLHVLTLSEIAAIVAFVASFIYLIGFFGISFVQSLIIPRSSHDDVWAADDDDLDQVILKEDTRSVPCAAAGVDCPPLPSPKATVAAVDNPSVPPWFLHHQRRTRRLSSPSSAEPLPRMPWSPS